MNADGPGGFVNAVAFSVAVSVSHRCSMRVPGGGVVYRWLAVRRYGVCRWLTVRHYGLYRWLAVRHYGEYRWLAVRRYGVHRWLAVRRYGVYSWLAVRHYGLCRWFAGSAAGATDDLAAASVPPSAASRGVPVAGPFCV